MGSAERAAVNDNVIFFMCTKDCGSFTCRECGHSYGRVPHYCDSVGGPAVCITCLKPRLSVEELRGLAIETLA